MKTSIYKKFTCLLIPFLVVGACQTMGYQMGEGGKRFSVRQLEDRLEFYSEESYRRGQYLEAIRYTVGTAEITKGLLVESIDSSRHFAKAIDWLNDIRFELIASPSEGWVQKDYSSSLIVRISLEDNFLEGVVVEVSEYLFVERKASLLSLKEYVSNSKGTIEIALSTPQMMGTYEISLTLPIEKILGETVAGVRFSDETYNLIEEAASPLSLTVSIPVFSEKADFPIAIYVADTDATGNNISTRSTQEEIQQILEEGGITVQSVENRFVLTRSEAIQIARDADIPRIAFGKTEIRQFDESEAGISIEVFGRVEVVDANTNISLLTVEEMQRTSGTSSSTVLRVAFQALGKKIGNRIFLELP